MRQVVRGVTILLIALALLLGPTVPVAGTDRFVDAVGDGSPDIVAVSVSLTGDDVVVFEIEFADDYDTDSGVSIGIGHPSVVESMGCWAYGAMYSIHLVPGSPAALLDRVTLESDVSGPLVTIRTPLEAISGALGATDPPVMYFRVDVRLGDDRGDGLPGDSSYCISVPLAAASPTPLPTVPVPPPGSGATGGAVGWPAVAAAGVVVLCALGVVGYVAHGRARALPGHT